MRAENTNMPALLQFESVRVTHILSPLSAPNTSCSLTFSALSLAGKGNSGRARRADPSPMPDVQLRVLMTRI